MQSSENSKDHRSVQNCVAAPSTDFTANFESTYYARPSFSTFQSACSLASNAWAPQYVEWSTMCHFCTRRGSTKQRYWDKNTSFYKWSVYCCDIIGFKSTAGIGTLRCLPCFNTSVVETSGLNSIKGCVCVCAQYKLSKLAMEPSEGAAIQFGTCSENFVRDCTFSFKLLFFFRYFQCGANVCFLSWIMPEINFFFSFNCTNFRAFFVWASLWE